MNFGDFDLGGIPIDGDFVVGYASGGGAGSDRRWSMDSFVRHGSDGRVVVDDGDTANFSALSAAAQDWLNGGFGTHFGPTSLLQVIALDPPLNWDAGTVAGIVEHTASNVGTQLSPAGVYGAGFASFAGGVTGHMVRGGDFDALMAGAGTCDLLYGSVHYAQQDTGTVGTIAAVRATCYQPTGTATNVYGLFVDSLYAVGTISGEAAGVKVSDITPSTAYAIRTGANPVQFGTSINIGGGALVNAANDGDAATGGVAVGQMYRNGSALMIRVT